VISIITNQVRYALEMTMQTLTLPVPGGTLAVDRHGTTGTPVVCIHGLGDTRSTWRALVPLLVAAGHVVYVLDLRGHGESSTGFASYAAHDIGDDVAALLEAEDLRDAVLVGNSISGGAVCHAALEAPERVARLVLVCPFVRDMPADRWLRPLVPILFGGPWGAWAWGMYRATLFTTAPEDHADNQAAVLANLREPGRLAATRAMIRASKAPIAARLDQVSVPSLVVMGAEDPDFSDPAAEAEALRGLLGGPVEVAMVQRTGHYPQIERPDATAATILGFIGQGVEVGA
jgi:pimeloyl-ACP methyl ester carboxylesterase